MNLALVQLVGREVHGVDRVANRSGCIDGRPHQAKDDCPTFPHDPIADAGHHAIAQNVFGKAVYEDFGNGKRFDKLVGHGKPSAKGNCDTNVGYRTLQIRDNHKFRFRIATLSRSRRYLRPDDNLCRSGQKYNEFLNDLGKFGKRNRKPRDHNRFAVASNVQRKSRHAFDDLRIGYAVKEDFRPALIDCITQLDISPCNASTVPLPRYDAKPRPFAWSWAQERPSTISKFTGGPTIGEAASASSVTKLKADAAPILRRVA